MTLLQATLGHVPVDLLITNVTLANVLTGESYPVEIGIYGQHIASVERPGTTPAREVRATLDGRGRLAVPGLIDSHLHIESTLVTPAHFAAGVLPHGTTTVAEDPHEVANVMGLDGVRLFWQASQELPLKICYLVPTCVPSAHGLETAGGTMDPVHVREMLAWPGVLGLAEVMDSRAIAHEDPRMTAIVAEGRAAGKVIEGHNPMLDGRELQAYIAAGVDSDHTLSPVQRILDKLRLGVTAQLQERYLSRELVEAICALPAADICLVTDDVGPEYLEEHGHLDQVLRTAIRLGMPPMTALRAATVVPARRLRLYDRGVIGPGRLADIVLVDDLAAFGVSTVIANGQVVVDDGRLLWAPPRDPALEQMCGTVRRGALAPADFAIESPSSTGQARARVIVCVPAGTATRSGEVEVAIHDGYVALDGDDLARIAVFERYGHGDGRGLGLVQGLGLHSGAIASTYAHDSHNLVVIGHAPEDMAVAANAVLAADGGLAVARDGQILAQVALPLAGIISPEQVPAVAAAVRDFTRACAVVGVVHPHLLMRLSTFTLPVSAGLRITDRGLVDAERRELTTLWP